MNKKKVPYGIFDYKTLVDEDYYYIDKTMYFEKLENSGKVLMYLRPGRFGKSLFTSTMSYYYDIRYKKEYKNLFKDTYVYKYPTKNRNSYYILKLDFSGIKTSQNEKDIEKEFYNKVESGIKQFGINYNFKLKCLERNNSCNSRKLILDFLNEFHSLKTVNKLYIIIDEYDNFTNAIIKEDGKLFKDAVGTDGFIRVFYAVIKEFCGMGTIDRVFITGICPVTMDSLTTGFNICKDISRNLIFNSMIGLTHNEVYELIKDIDKENANVLFGVMKDYYNGYLFNSKSDEKVFNATLVMYFLDKYITNKDMPVDLIDNNIYVNYGKIKEIINFKNNNYIKDIIKDIYEDNKVMIELKSRFDLTGEMTYSDIASLLYYFGYLTYSNKASTLVVPNRVVEEVYGNYFNYLLKENKVEIRDNKKINIINNLINNGDITELTNYVRELLNMAGNRVLIKFDERYIQLMYYMLLIDNSSIYTYLEKETSGGYTDIYVTPSSYNEGYSVLIELKYLSKDKYSEKLLKEKENDAIYQIKRYIKDFRVAKDKLRCYAVVFVGKDPKVVKEVNMKELNNYE